MFKKLDTDAAPTIRFTFNGRQVDANEGDTIATALLAAGELTFRRTTKEKQPRGPYCMMGSCFECIVELDGEDRRQACLEPVVNGLRVTSVQGGVDA